MATENSGVIIRPARPEDFDDLLQIDVYSGRDYLEAGYRSYFDDPNIYPLVAEVNGKAVGFYMNQRIDGGRTLIKRAARVHPDYRGKGILHLLSEALDKHRKEFWPLLEHEVIGVPNTAEKEAVKGFLEKGFVEIVRKRILNLKVRLDDLKGLDANPEGASRITLMTHDDVKLLFAHNDVINTMVPNGLLYNWFLGYKILEENIKYFVGDDAFVFASSSAVASLSPTSDSSVLQEGHNFTEEAIKQIDILSFAHKHVNRGVLVYWIDLYTAEGYDGSLIRSHLLKHLQDLRQSTRNDAILVITLNPGVSEELVLASLRGYGIEEVLPDLETHEIFYERKLTD